MTLFTAIGDWGLLILMGISIYLLQSTDDCRFGNYYYAVFVHIRKYQQRTNDMR